jgi:hypothetical protein
MSEIQTRVQLEYQEVYSMVLLLVMGYSPAESGEDSGYIAL